MFVYAFLRLSMLAFGCLCLRVDVHVYGGFCVFASLCMIGYDCPCLRFFCLRVCACLCMFAHVCVWIHKFVYVCVWLRVVVYVCVRFCLVYLCLRE